MEDRFWEFVKIFKWSDNFANYHERMKYVKKAICLSHNDIIEFYMLAKHFKENLKNAIIAKCSEKEYELLSDDAFWDLCAHIVGLGKDVYYKCLSNPCLAFEYVKDTKENFEYIFYDEIKSEPEVDKPVLVKTRNGKYAVTSMYIPKNRKGEAISGPIWKGSKSFTDSIVSWIYIPEF